MLRSLSARLLVLTVFFVMLAEVFIFVPSVARFRLTYLEAHIASAHLAILALEATPDNMVSEALANELLSHAGAHGIVLRRPGRPTLMIDREMPPTVDETIDLREVSFMSAVHGAALAYVESRPRVLRVVGRSPKDMTAIVEVLLDEAPMRAEMASFGVRILQLSFIISLITAALVFASLRWFLVRPMLRITAAMMDFRADPEDPRRAIVPSRRTDEIGLAERELAELQDTVRMALRQRARLAALGTAVGKINHDLRNMLSTARLLSDALATSVAPDVQRVVPKLVAAIDRAVDLCTQTLDFAREGTPPLRPQRFALLGLVQEVAQALRRPDGDNTDFQIDVARDLTVVADRDQVFRALFNLSHNAVAVGAHRVTIGARRLSTGVEIDLRDDGPGLPPKARDNLFKPFTGSARPGGTGLGLAIARDILRSHGGDLVLVDSTAAGTVFRLSLPSQTSIGAAAD